MIDPRHRANAEALARLPSAEIDSHLFEYAVLVDGAVRGYFKTNREAILTARRDFQHDLFSVRRVEPQPADLGFVDHRR
jgi:hypothetical protein